MTLVNWVICYFLRKPTNSSTCLKMHVEGNKSGNPACVPRKDTTATCARARFVDPRMHILRIIIKVVLLPRCLSVPWEHSSRRYAYAQIDKQWSEGKPCWSKLQVASTFMSMVLEMICHDLLSLSLSLHVPPICTWCPLAPPNLRYEGTSPPPARENRASPCPASSWN